MNAITRKLVQNNQRIEVTAELFGMYFPVQLEPYVYSITGNIAFEYNGGYWEFYQLSNGGFYMAPSTDILYQVSCENGYEGKLSADSLGITACLYAYSHLSFSNNPALAEICAQQYQCLREYMLEHKEVRCILGAID
ncbi:MAG: antirestriction protein [Methylotenera sp.]|nr:antirestriction protein [Methylotenera sp.]